MKIKVRRSISIEAEVQEMSAEDVRSRIGTSAYNEIKSDDAHPMFVDLKVAKQGSSFGPIIIGKIRKTIEKLWGAPRIRELANLITSGTAIMFKHKDGTNDHEGREKVGRTLAGWTETEGDSLVARGVAYISSAYAHVQEMIRDHTIDTCSLEAGMRLSIGGKAKLVVDKVLNLSAIALCRTGIDGIPGFRGATIVGAVQEMAKLSDVLEEAGIDLEDVDIVGSKEKELKSKNSRNRGRRRTVAEDGAITLSEIKVAVDEGGISPDKIYPLEKLLGVPAVKDAVQAEGKEQIATKTTEHDTKVQELEDELKKRDDTIKERDTSIEGLKTELAPHQGQLRKSKVADIVKKSALLENAPKAKTDYIADQVASALPVDMDLSTDEGGVAIDKGIKEQIDYIKTRAIQFGEGEPEKKTGDKDDLEDEITGPVNNQSTGGNDEVKDVKDAMAAGVNPFEPGAVAAHKGGK